MKILAMLALVFCLTGCGMFANPVTGPGPDGIPGTADDERGDSQATEMSKTLATVLTLLGFGAVGAGLVGVTEGASAVVTAVKKKKDA